MRTESYQLFAQLCEGLLFEDSTSLDLVRKLPGGQAVIKSLHKTGLSHDQAYTPISKISWSELKDSYRGAWVIIQGDKGVGAIRARNGSYQAIASTDSEIRSFQNERGGNIIDFLKGEIGQLRKFYVGKETGAVADVQKARKELQKVPGASAMSTETIVNKFKPLWVKAMTAAAADIKGMAANMIKNDAYGKARKKLELLEKIEAGLVDLEGGGSNAPDFIISGVKTAVLMAASHYYPEKTGNISANYRGYSAENDLGSRQLLADISQGDQKKLGTVLGFFKRSLISG